MEERLEIKIDLSTIYRVQVAETKYIKYELLFSPRKQHLFAHFKFREKRSSKTYQTI